MNDVLALQLVAEALGVPALQAEHKTFGHNSITYEVTLPDRSVMVRTNANAQVFAKTEHNLAILRELGLPVPKVLASDLTQARFPVAYMILDKIPGRDLGYELSAMTPAQMTCLADQIVSFQRQVMTLPQGNGYGYVAIGESGPFSSWWELIRSGKEGAESTNANDPFGAHERRILRQAERFEPYFLQVPPTCFLDDITVKNVIMQNGELQGLVDFDCVCYGDPLYWMALTAVGVVSDVGPHKLFYVEELKRLWGLTEEQEQVLALYSAWMSLDFLRWFAAEGTPEWTQRMLTAMDQWMELVE